MDKEKNPLLEKEWIAVVKGEPIAKIPDDLYIPPNALKVVIDAFQGPLDLLLYLIKRNNMDIMDIQVATITAQYMHYIEIMESSRFELAGEYLVMAATLTEMKSRFLLPNLNEEEPEEDPRATLVRRLQEYELFKRAAESLNEISRLGRDFVIISISPPKTVEVKKKYPEVHLNDILLALSVAIKRQDMFNEHVVERETMSIRERMVTILNQLKENVFVPFVALFSVEEGRMGVIVTFLALMELIRESMVEIVQNESYGAIHVKVKNG